MSEQKDSMAIWNRHKKTNPDHTKRVNQRGGYTAINPMHQAEIATREFGPYGFGWWVSDLDYELIDTEKPSNDKQIEKSYSLCLNCKFNYRHEGGVQSFPVSADMPFKHGQDCYKKLRTECQSKALSLLGFNADIYQGNWESNEYVEARRREFGDQETRRAKGLQAIAEASSIEIVNRLKDHILTEQRNEVITLKMASELLDAANKRIEQMEAQSNA